MSKIDSEPQHPNPQPGIPGQLPPNYSGVPPQYQGQFHYNSPGHPAQGPPPTAPYGAPVMMQPQMTTNTVVVQQPAAPTVLVQGQRGWSSGLCACGDDVSMCLLVACFPQCYELYLAHKMDECCCLPCCVPGALIAMRAHFRGKHNIRGSIFDDCCLTMCCYQCVMCQLSREVDIEKNTGIVIQQPQGFATTTVVTH